MMPVMDGAQFRNAQCKDAALAAIPVVVMSADNAGDRKARALNIQRSLRKPFNMVDLLTTVEEYCGAASVD